MVEITARYEVRLYLNGQLIGDIRPLAQGLKWVRRRTKAGADEIDFTLNDVLFSDWCEDRGWTIKEMLRPLCLECRVLRNGVEVVGGFLATMPGYQPNQVSANLSMRFDGFLNLLNGVYIRPIGTVRGRMDALIQRFITEADQRAENAGKAYGFTAGEIEQLPSITNSFDDYKSTKDWICDRSDNVSGAGPFDLYFHADKTYDLYSAANFGDVIVDWTAYYPTRLNDVSVTSISAGELSGFASAVIGIGSGETSSEEEENTAIVSEQVNSEAVQEYGYFERVLQNSSVSRQETLDINTATELANVSNMEWQPEITLSGRTISPVPTGNKKIWIGDTITIENSQDLTGMTNGKFRVNELEVDVSANGGESIRPVLERVPNETEG